MAASKYFNPLTKTVAMLLYLVFAPTLMAQDWGLKAGVSVSDQTYDYSVAGLNVDRLNQSGMAAGIFINLNFSPLTSVRFGVDYVQKGSGIDVLIMTSQYVGQGTKRFEDRIDYLSINLLATPSLIKVPPISPYLIIGPRVDVLISSNTYIETLSSENLKSSIIGASVGAGFKLSIAPASSLFVEAVYQPDFSDTFKIETLTIKNKSFLISAGILF
jgi:hypothetical protein